MALTYPENTVWYIEARPWSGSDKKNPGFASDKNVSKGSGVVITLIRELENGERKPQTYILTCAHVVRTRDFVVKEKDDLLLEDIICYPPGKGFFKTVENKRRSGESIAKARVAVVSKYSPCKGELGSRPDHLKNNPALDWVLLEIDDPLFRNHASVKEVCKDDLSADQTLQVIGFPGGDATWEEGDMVSPVTAEGFRLRGDSTPAILDYEGGEETRAGMSGCGIFDDKGVLVGIHRSSTDASMKKEGVRIERIIQEVRETHQMKFVSEASAKIDSASQIQQLQMSLISRLEEIKPVFLIINEQLQRMVKEEVQEKDEIILNHVEQFLGNTIDADTFIGFFQSLNDEDNDKPDYQTLVEQLKNGKVIFCLGQELSHLFGAQLPSTEEIKKHLSEQDIHVPLSELCEQKELLGQASKRTGLLTSLSSLFMNREDIHAVTLYELLAKLDKPSLIISTGYDDLLEQSLRGKFVVIHPDITTESCLLKFSDQKSETSCSPDDIAEHALLEAGYTVIYRLRGDIVSNEGHLLLSEKDYFTFSQRIVTQFPEYIRNRLRNPKNSLWIMGHHPESWEERLLVRLLQSLRQDKRSLSIAVQEDARPFAHAFWKDNDVTHYNLPLAEFVKELEAAL